MNQQLAQTLPANLKQYVGDNHGYVPPQAQKQIAGYMEKMPGHLKQYSGAYMQQQVVQPSFAAPRTTPGNRPPVPDKLRLGHSMPTGEQFNVAWAAQPAQQNQAAVAKPSALPPAPPPYDPSLSAPNPQNDYAFIMDPAAAPRRSFLSGSGSSLNRILVVAGALLVLVIVFAVIKSFVGGGSNVSNFVGLAQDQQAMLQIAKNAEDQTGLSANTKNFAVTADVSLTTSKGETLQYLKLNHTSVKAKVLALKVSASTTTQLANAASAGTYEQTFHEIMSAKLKNYASELQQAYSQDKGVKGRKLLSDEFTRTQLLQQQLDAPAN